MSPQTRAFRDPDDTVRSIGEVSRQVIDQAQQIRELRALAGYVRDVRKIACHHAHPGPDDACARCQIDKALAGEHVSHLVLHHFGKAAR